MQREIKFCRWDEFPKYEVGDNGSVYSLDYNHTGKRVELKQSTNDEGYNYVFLIIGGKRYKRLVHRMVAICFIPNPQNKPQVNHLNSIRNDNDINNLEWCTAKENTIHGWNQGRVSSKRVSEESRKRFSGENNPKAKINEATVLSIRRCRAKGDSLRDISERVGLSIPQVSSIANNKSWAALTPELLTPKPQTNG